MARRGERFSGFKPRHRVLWIVAGVFLCLCDGQAEAQGLQQAVFLQPAPAGEQLTPELLESRRKEAAESTDLSDDAKKKVDDHYKVAVEGLRGIAELNAKAAQFKQDADDVQARVRKLKERLAELQSLKPALPDLPVLTDLEQDRTKRDVLLNELKASLAKAVADAEPAARPKRRNEIRAMLSAATQQATELDKLIAAPAPPEEPPLVTQARQAELRVRRLMVDAEQPARLNELSKFDAEDSVDYLRLERDVRTQEVAFVEAELKLYDEKIADLLDKEKKAARQRARDEAIAAQPLLKSDADINRTFAEQTVALTGPTEGVKAKLEATKIRLEGVKKQFITTQQKVENIGLSGAVGALLRRQRSELPNLLRRQANIRNRRKVIEDAQYELFEADDIRAQLANRDPLVDEVLQNAPAGMTEAERSNLDTATRDVLDRRADYLDQLIRSYNTYLDTLFELDQTEQLLIAETQSYITYIDERVLWIRSNDPLFSRLGLDTSDRAMLEGKSWTTAGLKLLADVKDQYWQYAIACLFLVPVILLKPRFRRELNATGMLARKGNCTSFAPTWKATWITVLVSVPWPGLIWFLGYRLSEVSNGSDISRAIAQGLTAAAWSFLPLELLRRICRVGGLADHHLDWPDSTIRLFRSRLPALTLAGIPLIFLTTAFYAGDSEHGLDIPERGFFVAATLVLAVFLHRVLRPSTGILREFLTSHPDGWLVRTKRLWHWGSVLAPLSLAGLAIAGFYYTAQQLAGRLFSTILLVIALQLVRALLQRLLIVQRRKLTIERAKQRRAELAAQHKEQSLAEKAAGASAGDYSGGEQTGMFSVTSGPGAIVPAEELRAEVEAHTEQSRRLLGISVVTASLVGIWLIWVDVLPALRILDQWHLWATTIEISTEEAGVAATTPSLPGTPPRTPGTSAVTGSPTTTPLVMLTVVRHVTPRDVGLALLIVVLTVACARNIPGLMEMWVLERLPLDQSVRYAITTLVSYLIILLGVILSFNAISVGWSKVQWLATALTFGLAFGLQEIFANFVAGLILLFERPIRIGDVVTVDEVTGVVSRIRMRATTITNWDRKEYVIPNKEFITGRMLNWTLSDKVNRVVINVGVAYGSNVDKAKELLFRVCSEHPLTLDEPGTIVAFEGFGDNSLNFVVRTYLPNLDNRLKVIDALHTNIDRAFREAGIEIAFPQRDLHLRSVDPSVASVLRGAPAPSAGPDAV